SRWLPWSRTFSLAGGVCGRARPASRRAATSRAISSKAWKSPAPARSTSSSRAAPRRSVSEVYEAVFRVAGRVWDAAIDQLSGEKRDMTTIATFDPRELESKVKAMYRSVAENPHGEFHFEMGRAMAERLGYAPADLDRIPAEAIESFAGVGYYFHLADPKPGETVVDFGSGSGMDTFVAALKVGPRGKVIGVDMTDAQRAKAERLRDRDGFPNVTYMKGYIEQTPLPDGVADIVISNGVINLATD